MYIFKNCLYSSRFTIKVKKKFKTTFFVTSYIIMHIIFKIIIIFTHINANAVHCLQSKIRFIYLVNTSGIHTYYNECTLCYFKY